MSYNYQNSTIILIDRGMVHGHHIWQPTTYAYPVGIHFIAFWYEKWYLNIYLVTTFTTTFSFILTLLFILSLYCYGFRANTTFFFVKYGCQISCHQIGCSNNTPLLILGLCAHPVWRDKIIRCAYTVGA